MVSNICLTKEHCYHCELYRPIFRYLNASTVENKIDCLFSISRYDNKDLLSTYPKTTYVFSNIFKGTLLDLKSDNPCDGICKNCLSLIRHDLCLRLASKLRKLTKEQYIPYYKKE